MGLGGMTPLGSWICSKSSRTFIKAKKAQLFFICNPTVEVENRALRLISGLLV